MLEMLHVSGVEPRQAAVTAGLRYVTDQTPGIRRVRVGKRFRYVTPHGTTLTDRNELQRISRWHSSGMDRRLDLSRADGHLQATGRDARGGSNTATTRAGATSATRAKYGRMLASPAALPRIRRRIERDLALPGLPREKVLAAVVELLELTPDPGRQRRVRPRKRSFGLTTMRDGTSTFRRARSRFLFRGKSGKEHEIGLRRRGSPGSCVAAETCRGRSCSSTSTTTVRPIRSDRPT